MASQIIRLRRTDSANQHLLVKIRQPGSKTLDLKLIGTEHEHLYHATFKESNVKSLQANNYAGTLDEWKDILKFGLLHEKPEGQLPEHLQGIETVAAVSGTNLTITLRKNIGGITQRLGIIKLEQNDEKEEISAFEWADAAVAACDDLRTQLDTLQASVSNQQQQVASLNQQLDDLVKAKKDHEDELLKKFAALLNAKKLKIRDQQRLLSGAKIDGDAAENVSNARSGRGRKAAPSRGGKRKAKEAAPDLDDEILQDYDEQEADEAEADEDEARRQAETPPQSDEEATDDEGELNGTANLANMEIDEPEEPPPRRELPFARKNVAPAKQTAPATANDDDDETDDEL